MPAFIPIDDAIDLTVIVPVYNAKSHLRPLVEAVLDIDGLNCQVILVDDCSVDGSGAEIADLVRGDPRIVGLYHDENRGAGHARNLAWPHARGRYTIFFDADDQLHPEVILPALAHMDADPEIDTAMFAYRYMREETGSFTAMSFSDQKAFDTYLQGANSIVAPLADMSLLLKFTNYPWNKIIRTSHFRETGMRYGSTKVNNDILGHWHSLLFARRILLCNQVICTHFVFPQGQNLTNRFTAERLQMFDALNEAYDLLQSHPALRRRFVHHYWGLVEAVMKWARPRVAPDYKLDFESRYRELICRVQIEDFVRMRKGGSSQIADRLVKDLLG